MFVFSFPGTSDIYILGKLPNSLQEARHTSICGWHQRFEHATMYSITVLLVVMMVNFLFISSTMSEPVEKKSQSIRISRMESLDPSTPYPKANPPSPSPLLPPKDLRRRNNLRRGQSCSDTPPNPLKNPFKTADPVDDDFILPTTRVPFSDIDERYCPMFQYAVCDSGVFSERILRVAVGKWTLKNCRRCKFELLFCFGLLFFCFFVSVFRFTL